MSVEALSWAWRTGIESTPRKLVLVAVADAANEDGICWPSHRRLGEKCGMRPETVRGHLRKLEEDGLLRRVEQLRGNGSRTSNRYELVMDPPGGNPPPGENPPGTPGEISPDQNRNKEPSNTPPTPSPVEIIWDHFTAMRGASPKPIRRQELDSGTRRMIQRALEVGTEEEWSRAVYALLNSPHHLGRNDRGKAYLEPRHVFTACTHGTVRGHLDWLLDLAPQTADPLAVDGGTSSALAVKIREAKRNVLAAYDLAGSDEARRKGDESERWLAQHGIQVVRDENRQPRFEAADADLDGGLPPGT